MAWVSKGGQVCLDLQVISQMGKRLTALFRGKLSYEQCDQIKIAKCLQKLPKNDFTRKMNDFEAFTKIA